jgi:hypothetical protein
MMNQIEPMTIAEMAAALERTERSVASKQRDLRGKIAEKGDPWPPELEASLIAAYNAGESLRDWGMANGRTYFALQNRLAKFKSAGRIVQRVQPCR